ncbi:MAG: hypothetical protein S4CHLAM7_06340 [Chlamydiae bacterium]|nr:hypothetical protein [Chlamydiota bacterium]
MIFFQDLIKKLSDYWASKGCAVQFGYDLEMGAGTFNPATFLRSLGPEPYKAAYVEPSRRPTDGRYGANPNRLQHYFQFQVVMKPAPLDIQQLYLGSLKALGLSNKDHDIRFIHDDWKSPTLGAWGMGWEIQVDGMEVSQFTYFQNMGGISLKTITGEITYGLERIAMYLQNIDNVYDLQWNKELTYGDIYHQNEVQWSTYNFEEASVDLWKTHFENFESECSNLIEKKLPLPAYDFAMKASHAFNILDARGVISVTDRVGYINRIRNLSCKIAHIYLAHREAQSFPLLKAFPKKKLLKGASSFKEFDIHKKSDFLLEIRTEELPPSFAEKGMKHLKKDLETLLKQHNLPYNTLKTYSTPRRLVAYVEDLSGGIPAKQILKRGPPVNKAFCEKGQLTSLGMGFFKSLDKPVKSLQSIRNREIAGLEIQEKGGAEYLFVKEVHPEISILELLSKELPALILSLDFPQKMLWSDLEVPFPRPIHSISALFGSHVISFEVAGIESSNKTLGHPNLSSETLIIKKADNYLTLMKKACVIIDPDTRRSLILEQLKKLESQCEGRALEVNSLVNEMIHLTEYPHLILGSFDEKYLKAPKELLALVMVHHQKYFPVEDSSHRLLPNFIVCVDNKPTKLMKIGHERAITPRLADGLFVYQKDLDLGLSKMVEKLQKMTFQKELGNLSLKASRILRHATALNPYLQSSTNSQLLEKAATFLKADLASHLVFEFPELQGVIGSHYAEVEQYPLEVSQAIQEHWLPRFEEDKLPQSQLGLLFALADRLDNLLACFLTGQIPSSSSDPFALRRQAFGVIRILIEHKVHLPLHDILQVCASHFNHSGSQEALTSLRNFFDSRLKTVLTQYTLKADEVQAVLGQSHFDIYDLFLRAQALHNFKKDPQFQPFIEVFKRAKGQLNTGIAVPVNPTYFQEPIEEDLYDYLLRIEPEFLESIEAHQYEASFLLLSSLQPYLAKLFDQVKILTDDEKVRMNRLALLKLVLSLFAHLLDFSQVHS